MRYLLLSDVHANAVALEAVLGHARSKAWEQVIFLGDAVGYYSEPEAVIQTLQTLPLHTALVGNHDAVLLRGEAVASGRSLVNDILARQRTELGNGAKAFLAQLSPVARTKDWEAVHSTLAGTWDYINALERAQLERPRLTRDLLFFGHTHVAVVYLFTEAPVSAPGGPQILSRSVPLTRSQTLYRLPPRAQIMINPGSVGQPRDGVALAAYAVYDEERRLLEHYRVPFDIRAVQKKLEQAGYPAELGTRLEWGR